MLFFNLHESPVARLVKQRAQLLIATRNLLYADAELMDDLGNSGCDYCGGGDEDVPDGHDLSCNFATAFELLLQERAVGEEEIRKETMAIRDALVMLIADDFSMMLAKDPCWYCESEHSHTDECVFNNAIETLSRIKREDLL